MARTHPKTTAPDLRQRILEATTQIPLGRVSTYKAIALAVGTHPRVVGRWLHTNDDTKQYPCHRVVRSDGRVAAGYAFGGPGVQQRLLAAEGVQFVNGTIDLDRFLA